MKLKRNDKVLVIAGKDKGKIGKIVRVIPKHERIVVEKMNMRTKHIKKGQGRPGERVKYEAPMHHSNVMILDPKENKPTRIGYRVLENGKKERISKLTGSSLDSVSSSTAAEEAKPTKSTKKKTVKA